MTPDACESRIRIGPWRIDVESASLQSNDGREAHLSARALGVLLRLIEADGEVVGKDELLDRVWSDVTVTENSLNQAISELRRALGDDRAAPRYVETIRGRGYRLIADATPHEPMSPPVKFSPLSRRALFSAGGAIAAVVIGGVLIRSPASNRASAIAVSPDGLTVARIEAEKSVARLSIADRGEKHAHILQEIPAPESLALAWAPDGQRIVLNATRARDPYYAVNIVSRTGAPEMFIKFAKDPSRHQEDSVPDSVTGPQRSIVHEEWSSADAMVHRVAMGDERLSIVFQHGLIAAFVWV